MSTFDSTKTRLAELLRQIEAGKIQLPDFQTGWVYEVQSNEDRTPYDFIPFDSEVEKGIAEKLDSSEAVKFFCKLPRWFKIATPLGDYNPDWAVVLERGIYLHLVRESKDTHDRDKRRDIENRKIDCGRAHFDALGVDYEVATNIQEVVTPRAK